MNCIKYVLLLILVWLIFPSIPLHAQFFYEEPGRNPMGIFQLYQSAIYTASGTNDPNGWLRLTPNQPDKLGYVMLDRVFPGSQGVCVEFDYKVYGGGSTPEADGFSIFLIDATPAAGPFKHGLAAGGGLGFTGNKAWYTTTGVYVSAKTGASPTYLGVGIDEYGNFSNTANTGMPGGPGFTSHAIAIRAGSQDSQPYRYLAGTGTRLAGTSLNGTVLSSHTPGRPADNAFYRRLRVNFEPSGNGVKATVFLKTSTSNDYIQTFTYTYTSKRPDQMRVGFAATTGQQIAMHEVRDIIMRTPGELQVFKQIPDCITKDNTSITTIIACNTIAQNGIVVADTLPVGYKLLGTPTITNGTLAGGSLSAPATTLNTSSGDRLVYNYTVNAPANTIVRVLYNGYFDPATLPNTGGVLTTSAGIQKPGFYGNMTPHVTMTRSINGITRITPTSENVTYTSGSAVNFQVSAAPGATLKWEHSRNGVSWVSGNNTTSSFTPSIYEFQGNDLYVRCMAQWTAGCRDTLIWKCTTLPPITCEMDFAPVSVPNVSFAGGNSQTVEVLSCCTSNKSFMHLVATSGVEYSGATISSPSSTDGRFYVTFPANLTTEMRMVYVIVQDICTSEIRYYPFYQDGKWMQDDRATVLVNTTDNRINVLDNDRLPDSCATTATPNLVSFFAKHGNAAVDPVTKELLYTPDPGFTGKDSLMYNVTCGITTATAVVYITVAGYPDNVIDATCVVDSVPQYEWKIKDMPTLSANNYNTLQPVFTADLDGDKKSEMFTTNNINGYTNRLYILNSNADVINSFSITQTLSTALPIGAVGKVKTASGDKVLIFTTSVTTTTRRLYAYDTNGNLAWTLPNGASSDDYGTEDYVATVSLADLDGDGWSELVVGNRVFAAESGRLLIELTGSSAISHGENDLSGTSGALGTTGLSQSSVGEVLPGSGRLQVCAGNAVYDMKTIPNRFSGASSNITPVQTITPVMFDNTSVPNPENGCTQLVDLDLDGNLDVVVSTVDRTSKICYLYVWSPAKNTVIASAKISNVYKRGIPSIGDIDGDGFPEIVFMSGIDQGHTNRLMTDKIIALKYNPFAPDKQLRVYWSKDHNSKSGSMAMTLFDFNQDGASELVLRDEENLRIINGSLRSHVTESDTTIAYELATYPCTAYTSFEYPTVADIDNDGRAEILTVGFNKIGGGTNAEKEGPVRIFKAGDGTAWTSARNVWNQYAYNAVNINKDLTVPPYPLSPATAFPGGVQPYNAFLQQQTVLKESGAPQWLAPDVYPTGSSTYSYDAAGDSLFIHLNITNTGEAALQAPFYIATYKNTVSEPDNLSVDSVLTTLNVGNTVSKTVVIRNVSTQLTSPDSIIIRLNDDGKGLYLQLECDTVNNRMAFTLGLFQVSKSLPDCIQPSSDPASIRTKIANSLGGGPGSIGAQTGIAVSDTIPAGFTVTGNPASVPFGAATFTASIDTLSDGRQVYHYTVNIGVDEEVTVTYNGDFAKQDSTQSITTSAGINPAGLSLPSGIIILSKNLYVTQTDSVKSIILDTPDTKDIKYTVGQSETFEVKPDPRATFLWSYSTDNGLTWTYETGTQTNSYNPPSTLFNVAQNIRVRCQAGWSASCTDEVIYTLMPSHGLGIDLIPVNPHIRGFFK